MSETTSTEKTKQTRKRATVISLVCVLVVAAALAWAFWPEPTPTLEVPAGALALTDPEESTELLTDVRQWNLPQLEQHVVFLQDDCLTVQFAFSKDADASQLDRARSFVLSSFVLGDRDILGPYPYGDVIDARYKGELDWNSVNCQVWQGPDLVYEDVHDQVRFVQGDTAF